MFRTAIYSWGFKQYFLQGPLTEDLCSLLNAVNHIFQMFNFLKKINILFLLGVSRNAIFYLLSYFFQTHKNNAWEVQTSYMIEKSSWWRQTPLTITSFASHFMRQVIHTR